MIKCVRLLRIRKQMNFKNEVLYRVYVVFAAFVLAAMLIFGKAVKISVFEGEKWKAKSDSLYVKYENVEAQRGNIVAADGSFLSTSLPYYDIHFDLNADGLTEEVFNNNVDSLAYCMVKYIDNRYTVGAMRDFLIAKRKEGERYLKIKRNINFEELSLVKSFPIFRRGQFKGGFIVKEKQNRSKPFGLLAHRTIGYVREDSKPVGLEGYYNDILSGETGRRLVQRVSNKEYIPISDLSDIKPTKGKDVKTTLDVNMQDITQSALIDALKKHDASFGTAVLMEVETGALKAISNIGKSSDGHWFETYNYAVGTRVEPGSVFKLASVMALLEEGYTPDSKVFVSNGRTEFHDRKMVDSGKDSYLYDSLSLQRAFEISSNVGISTAVNEHFGNAGEENEWRKEHQKFVSYLKKYGLHLATNLEIDGEAPPLIKDPKDVDEWSGTTLPWLSIGYECLLTPLQVLTFFNAVANDGKMMRPYIVDEVLEEDRVIKKYKPTVVKRQIASTKIVSQVQSMLEGVVLRGTAANLRTKQYDFAAKTGTAQMDYSQKDKRMKYRSTFVGYFPADKPRYSCIVMITDPKRGGFYGAEVAGPVFRVIADNCHATQLELKERIKEYEMPKLQNHQLPTIVQGKASDFEKINENLAIELVDLGTNEWTALIPKNDTMFMHERVLGEDLVPNVKGMGLRDALYILENKGLKVAISGSGKVTKQSIKPGTKVNRQKIYLHLG